MLKRSGISYGSLMRSTSDRTLRALRERDRRALVDLERLGERAQRLFAVLERRVGVGGRGGEHERALARGRARERRREPRERGLDALLRERPLELVDGAIEHG